MPGYDSDGDRVYQLIDCEYEHSRHLREAVLHATDSPSVNLTAEVRCEGRSDHQSFWDIDQPAVMTLERFFGGQSDANHCYHKACDRVDILDFDYMRDLTQVLALAAMDLLEVP